MIFMQDLKKMEEARARAESMVGSRLCVTREQVQGIANECANAILEFRSHYNRYEIMKEIVAFAQHEGSAFINSSGYKKPGIYQGL